MILEYPAVQAFGAGTLSWLSVSAGAALIFARKNFSRFLMDCLLGAAGGMMLAAASLGLLVPALSMTTHLGHLSFLPIVCGLALGAAFLLGLDKLLPHLHAMQGSVEGVDSRWRRSALLVAAMALHHTRKASPSASATARPRIPTPYRQACNPPSAARIWRRPFC